MKAGNLRLVQRILPMEVIDPDRMTDVKTVVMIGTTEEITETEIEIIEIVIENPEVKNLGSIVKMVNQGIAIGTVLPGREEERGEGAGEMIEADRVMAGGAEVEAIKTRNRFWFLLPGRLMVSFFIIILLVTKLLEKELQKFKAKNLYMNMNINLACFIS